MPERRHPRTHLSQRRVGFVMSEVSMRLTISAFGLELDLTLGRQTPDTDDDVYVDCGTTVSTPVGFFRPEIPWDHDGPVHHFDPSEADEDI